MRWLRVAVWLVLSVVFRAVFLARAEHVRGMVRVGWDFRIYWGAGRLAGQGQDPYQRIAGQLGFVYPPFALLPFQVLAHWSRVTANAVWTDLNAVVLAGLVVAAWRRSRHWVWLVPVAVLVVLSGYTERCMDMGQMGIVLLGLVAFDLVVVGDRRGAGVLTGLAVGIKFTPAVFIVYFLARRQWRAAAGVAAGFVVSVVLGFVFLPHVSWGYWRELLVHHKLGHGVPAQIGWPNNQSLTNAVVMLWGGQVSHESVGRLVAFAVTLVGLVAGWVAARQDRRWLAVAVLGITSCLVTATTWDHHYVWVLAALLALGSREMRRMPVSAVVLLAWIVWSFSYSWHSLSFTPRNKLSNVQLFDTVATPLFAALFMLTTAAELIRQTPHTTPQPARPTT